MDHEALYHLVFDRQWGAVLDAMHRQAPTLHTDALTARAVDTFLSAFRAELAAHPSDYVAEAEKLFLLHTGHFYRLPHEAFEQVVLYLVAAHADRPEAARGYARYCPHHPQCAALLAPPGAPLNEPVDHGTDEALRVTRRPPDAAGDHTVSLFKSQQEVDFFMAVREVFATYFVYPNVALSCLVDFEALQERLSGPERQYFFRAQVDCVVFDQHDGYRPCFFFELDSPLHDTAERQRKDGFKDHILALAGQSLYRIRSPHAAPDRTAFVALLKALAAAG